MPFQFDMQHGQAINQPLQRTAEWFAARLGKVTASRVVDVLAKSRTGTSVSRTSLMYQLIAERLSGKPTNTYVSPEMDWGTTWEDAAREAYVDASGAEVVEVGLIDHPTIAWAGASPDGLVGPDTVLEIKCPTTKSHVQTLLEKRVPNRYFPQLAWQQACTDRGVSDFVSFDPRLPKDYQLIILPYYRDDKYVEMIENEVRTFLAEVAKAMAAIMEMNS